METLDEMKAEVDALTIALKPTMDRISTLDAEIEALENERAQKMDELEEIEDDDDFRRNRNRLVLVQSKIEDLECHDAAGRVINGAKIEVLRTFWDQDGNRIRPGTPDVKITDPAVAFKMVKSGVIAVAS